MKDAEIENSLQLLGMLTDGALNPIFMQHLSVFKRS